MKGKWKRGRRRNEVGSGNTNNQEYKFDRNIIQTIRNKHNIKNRRTDRIESIFAGRRRGKDEVRESSKLSPRQARKTRQTKTSRGTNLRTAYALFPLLFPGHLSFCKKTPT